MLSEPALAPALSTVSGVATTKTELVSWADKTLPALSLITTKSYQCVPNVGNREPILCEMGVGSYGNSVGLRNCGMEQAVAELTELRKNPLRCFLIVSVSGKTPEEFIALVKGFDAVADIIELNFSCPHAAAGYGASIGSDKAVAEAFVREIRKTCPDQESALFVKLTPNVSDAGEIARAVCDAGCDGLSAINTVGPEIHRHEGTGAPILQNALGGKGGKSGLWVQQKALEVIKSIRAAVGYSVPLIGMGGVASGEAAANMIRAGADAVGIGSAFGSVRQDQWADYLNALKNETQALLAGRPPEQTATGFLKKTRQMQYTPLRITEIYKPSDDTAVFTVDADIHARAGEFVFLWLPGIGEKPFSLAGINPARFVIKKRGKVSTALCNLQAGDSLFCRGAYGAPIQHTIQDSSYIFCGGTGIALAPLLCTELHGKSDIHIFLGMSGSESETGEGLFESELSQKASYSCVYDNGVPGRVLNFLPESFSNDSALYVIGPTVFMKKAVESAVNRGLSAENIYVSLEQNTMCGVGICGECAARHTLTCQSGTFFTAAFLQKEKIL